MENHVDKHTKMPVLFVGHGSPMNAIEENSFVQGWRHMADSFPKPDAILCISAHWETKGTFVTAVEKPKTIHDFGGFPEELYQVRYPAPGSPNLAKTVKSLIKSINVELDYSWGLDHGCWSVIKHMYPEADIPVVQLSLDYTRQPKYHFDIAHELSGLRNNGILIVGSGNLVHNLSLIDWYHPNGAHEWATEASEGFRKMMMNNEFEKLYEYKDLSEAYQKAIPTPEHFLPLLYILALKEKDEPIAFYNDQIVMGSLSMTSLKIG